MVWAGNATQAATVGQLNYVASLVTTQVPEPTQNHTLTHITASALTLVGQLAQTYNLTIGYSQQVYETAVTWANQAINVVYQDVVQAQQRADAAVENIQQEIQTEHANIVDYVAQSRDYAIQTSETWTTDAVNVVNDNITFIDEQLNNRITHEQQDRAAAVSLAFDEMGRINNDILGLISTQVLPRVAEIENFDEECSKPTCTNLLDFARLFGGAKAVLGSLEFIALLAELYRSAEGDNSQIIDEMRGFLVFPEEVLKRITG